MVQTNQKKTCKIIKNRTNLQETAGNWCTADVQNFDLTEPWREYLLIWRMDFNQNCDGHLFKKQAFPLGAGWKKISVSKPLCHCKGGRGGMAAMSRIACYDFRFGRMIL
jgi:hypothetical protein